MKTVVIVAPTYNEEENIEAFITNVLAQQIRVPQYKLEILISDSHSKDKTGEIVNKLHKKNSQVHFLDTKIPGPGKLGSGISSGLDYAVNKLEADLLITMEADLSNDPNKLPDFLAKLEKADLVVGSRYVAGGGVVNWSWWRKLLSLAANTILRILIWAPSLHEFTNLYRAFDKKVWIKLQPKISTQNGWLFVPAFIFEAIDAKPKFKIVEEPFTFYDRFGGRSKMNTTSYTKNLLVYALKFRARKTWNALSNLL